MKALLKKLLPLTLFAIAVTSLFSVQPAQAFTITLKEVGSNVVANGSGAFNVTGLTKEAGMFSTTTGIDGSAGFILTGTPGQTPFLDGYFGLTGPTNFGSGFFFPPDTGSGDFVGIFLISGARHIFVPAGYVSGTALSDSMTFNNKTFASLGVTPGTYVWSWGTGLRNQNFTLIIRGAGVPDGGSTVSLLGFGLLGLAALRLKLPLLRRAKS